MGKKLSQEERVDPRIKRTRQLLVQAFNDLLEEKSFEAMTVQDITKRATVNRATFYTHFEDKYALLDAVMTESFNQALVGLIPPRTEFTALNLQLLIQIVCEFLEFHFAHCKPSLRTQLDSLVEQQVKLQIHQVLVDWLKTIRSQDDAELRATAASWAIYGVAMYWSQGERKLTSSEFAHRTLPLILPEMELPETAAP